MTRHHLLRGDYWRYWWSFAASFEAKATLLLLPVATVAVVGAFVLIDRPDAGKRTVVGVVGAGPFEALGAVGGELRVSVLFNLWARSNSGELERYERFEADVLRGAALHRPEMVTPFGRALVAALTAAGRVEYDGPRTTARASGI